MEIGVTLIPMIPTIPKILFRAVHLDRAPSIAARDDHHGVIFAGFFT